MRILLIGDVVGKPGRQIITKTISIVREQLGLDVVIANAENAADGSGITPEIYRQLVKAGVDAITLGDHIYRRKEICDILETKSNIVKPANFPPDAPGRQWMVVESRAGVRVGVFSLLGRVYMRPVDCPFRAADRVLDEIPADVSVRLLDFHCEATSDKQLMGRYLDGRVSAVLGTHTHVPTADQQILPGGTAFQCDIGMTGPYESIIGRKIDRVLSATLTFYPTPFQVATGDVRLCGAVVDVDPESGQASSIERVTVTRSEAEEVDIRIN